MKKVAFYTLGCKVNQYETEALSGIFEKAGYEVADFENIADVYVINTCTVTNLSDRKSRQMIRKAKKNNPGSIVVVVGCYAQTAPEEVSKIPGVNLIIGTGERSRILEHIDEIEAGQEQINAVNDIMGTRYFEQLHVDSYKERTRAFLKIQEGCSQFCSYCIIPYARGPVRSRDPQEVIEEVVRLSKAGFKEVVLTGIHVASYGKDIRGTSLIDIIRRVHEVEGIERIRLGSIEPTTVTEEFVAAAGKLEKLCPHYHISLQSGCNETLKRMNRRYTAEEYKEVVDRLRANIKDVALTTDVMVGFPGETDREFEETLNFLKDIDLYQMHIFKYSPRKGTPAASYKNQIPPGKKDERSEILIGLSSKNTHEFNRKHLGKITKVLFEQQVKDRPDFIEGLTSNYIRVLCKGTQEMTGKMADVLLEAAEKDHMLGKIAGGNSE